MKILSIIAQKPDYTGSGIYARELINCFNEMGHEQSIICAKEKSDNLSFLDINNIKVYPVLFDCENVPFHVVGMSDEMPYDSTKYIDLLNDEKKLLIWKNIFLKVIDKANEEFNPDLIICHHLYLLTAIVKDVIKNKRIYGICHNTDLRQFLKTNLERDFIKHKINNLDKIFAPSDVHKNKISEIFGTAKENIEVVGIGYNNKIFKCEYKKNNDNCLKNKKTISFMYAGKIAKKKGVMSFVKAIKIFDSLYKNELKTQYGIDNIVFNLVGGAGNKEEYDEIVSLALQNSKTINNENISKIVFHNKKTQIELAKMYNENDVFVMPSFTEGIPMVVIEALACDMRIVCSDLPGVKDFIDSNVENHIIEYVSLPKLSNVDNTTKKELIKYENRIAKALYDIIMRKKNCITKVNNLSWKKIAEKMV